MRSRFKQSVPSAATWDLAAAAQRALATAASGLTAGQRRRGWPLPNSRGAKRHSAIERRQRAVRPTHPVAQPRLISSPRLRSGAAPGARFARDADGTGVVGLRSKARSRLSARRSGAPDESR